MWYGVLMLIFIEKYSKSNALLTCYDPSKEMLNCCRGKFNEIKPQSSVKVDFTDELKNYNNYYDIIMLNSVLHHIPDLAFFYEQASILLKNNGLLIIGHEPNQTFYNNKFLIVLSTCLKWFLSPKVLLIRLLEKLGLKNFLKSFMHLKKNREEKIMDKINEIILSDGLIEKKLSADEIYQYIDYHSPTASGKLDKRRGFSKDSLQDFFGKNFAMLDYTTYDFLNIKSNSKFCVWIDRLFSPWFYKSGSKFFLILKKK